MELNPGMHAHEARQLVDQGREIAIDHVWTYRSMGDMLGREIAGDDSALQVALRRLSRDHGVEFKNVRKVGYLRLSDEGIVDHAGPDRLAISRKVRRAAQRAGNVQNYEALNLKLQNDLNAHRTVLAIVREAVKPSSVRAIAREVEKAHREIDPREATIALFKKP